MTVTAVAVAAGAIGVAASRGAPAAVRGVAAPAPVARPAVAVPGRDTAGRVSWQQPLALAVTHGTVTAITVTEPDGAEVPGIASASGWQSLRSLIPLATYTARVTVRDAAGALRVLPVSVQTTAADRLVHAGLSPDDDEVVGVGRPIEVRLSRAVTDRADRAAVESRLTVRTVPRVEGSWRWMDDRTVHWRPAQFWRPGTKVRVSADLVRLALPDGRTWGSGRHTTAFTVGDALVSTVDVQAHTMTVRRDGQVLRVLPASLGRPQFPTRNGTFIVLEKDRTRVMDSATVNLPPGTPPYRTTVQHAVRITNSGTFTHGAPWSVAAQGHTNVSHGCINLSPADAAWFYDQVRLGDVVQVVNSTEGPNNWDAGSRDWNMSFAQWKQGSALATS